MLPKVLDVGDESAKQRITKYIENSGASMVVVASRGSPHSPTIRNKCPLSQTAFDDRNTFWPTRRWRTWKSFRWFVLGLLGTSSRCASTGCEDEWSEAEGFERDK